MLPHNLTAQVGYVGNRQNDMVRNQNLNYSQIGGGNASLPFNQPGLAGGFRTTAQVNIVRPLGRVKYDSLQVSVNRRMTNGLGDDLGLHIRESHRLVGRRHPDSGILASQQGHAGRQHAAQGRHLGDLRAAVRRRPEIRQQRRRRSARSLSDWQVNSYFTAFIGLAVQRDRGSTRRSTRTARSVADQVKSEVEILGGVGADVPGSTRRPSGRSPRRGSGRRVSTRCVDRATPTSI